MSFLKSLTRLCAIGLCVSMASQAAVEVNGLAAVANGRPITKREVAFMAAPLHQQLMARFPRRGPAFQREIDKVNNQILDELINRELILVEFKDKFQGSIPDSAVDSAIQREIDTLYNGKPAEFQATLNKMRMTRAKYETLTREKLIVQAMRAQQFNTAAPPTPDEVRAEYNREKSKYRDVSKDEVMFEKIFVPREPADRIATPDEQITLVEEIKAKIEAGADFGELAREHSVDAYAEDGGRTEMQPRSDLSPVFASIIFAEPEGTLIGPLESGGGFTLVRVIDIKEGASPPLSKLRQQMEDSVRRKKNSKRYDAWINRVRDRAIIKRMM